MSENPKNTKRKYKIYAFTYTDQPEVIKIGCTTGCAETRIRQLTQTSSPYEKTETLIDGIDAVREDGTYFRDNDVHRVLVNSGKTFPERTRYTGRDWYYCTKNDVLEAIEAVKQNKRTIIKRINKFPMREEQRKAVEETESYYNREYEKSNLPVHFLWNCKMRFGKTFTAYQLAIKIGWKRILVLTFKPAIENSWAAELASHVDFEGWEFITHIPGNPRNTLPQDDTNYIAFYSFQYLMSNKDNQLPLQKMEWDCIILDEYHFGSWRKKAQDIIINNLPQIERDIITKAVNEEEQIDEENEDISYQFNASMLKIKTKMILYLSGTPFRALSSGEFSGEQIYSWTYMDEQKAKQKASESNRHDNPYQWLPQMKMYTYDIGDELKQRSVYLNKNEFDLNAFFEAEKVNDSFIFKDEQNVYTWLNNLYGCDLPLKQEKYFEEHPEKVRAKFPFEDVEISPSLKHLIWFLPDIASCKALQDTLSKNRLYRHFATCCCAGNEAGIGKDALIPVNNMIKNNEYSITLTCGKLTTGVTVPEWSGIFMLRNCSAPETYFQAAFRVQNPWESGNKQSCYVFDFAPDRTLQQIVDLCNSSRYTSEKSISELITDFTKYLPVLRYKDGKIKELNADDVLQHVMGNVTANTVLKKWRLQNLFRTNISTMHRLLNDKILINSLDQVKYTSKPLGSSLKTVISETDLLYKTKRSRSGKESHDGTENDITDVRAKNKKEITESREVLYEKLRFLSDRLRIFMYLTDIREMKTTDIIYTKEYEIFRKITMLSMDDFQRMFDIGLINEQELTYGILYFRNLEDTSHSLTYTGINKHEELKK